MVAKGARPRNRLLEALSREDFKLFEPHLDEVFLELRARLETAGGPIESVYFPVSGLASMVANKGPNLDAEVGIIGHEGMTGSALVMGDDRAIHDCYIQMTCEAFRVDAETFVSALRRSKTLRPFLLRYVHAFHIQTSYTALVNARSKTDERLARWLLMCDDRVVGNRLFITHDFLAVMLGVRRPGVTVAIQLLESDGLIQSRRGQIIIRDRAGLIELANGSYGVPEAEYERLVLAPAHAS
ncbi:Crp/Fnr family transcriptional regulator [Mesorhizobium sp. ES1-1]|uniref:Crp/Fnr family transcriptional regulator n=1 Tax=Mesorhizobium sp. ES1-1 TaxID=2876629 RepID=UPI001CCA96CA|nr:Crp/Fnr family transcriptional regulator [Mesorhizobium sp. ES1-1]MBZ9677493.1 Crp/Fnr family transcriptional regulator [Mesorhizobium sp. ES1-1]